MRPEAYLPNHDQHAARAAAATRSEINFLNIKEKLHEDNATNSEASAPVLLWRSRWRSNTYAPGSRVQILSHNAYPIMENTLTVSTGPSPPDSRS